MPGQVNGTPWRRAHNGQRAGPSAHPSVRSEHPRAAHAVARRTSSPLPPSESSVPRLLALLAALLGAVVAVVPLAGAAEGDEDHPLLREARENVDEVAAQLDRAAADRDAAAAALDVVDERLAEVEQAVNEAAAAVRRQQLEVELAGERLAELREEADELEQRLADMARSLFVKGGANDIELVLAAGDVQAAIDRTAFLDVVSETDRADLETARAARTALAAQRERFDAETERLLRMEEEQEALLASVEELRATRAQTLATAEREVDDLEATKDDLAGEEERIAELIANAASTPVAASPPSTEGFIWPVCSSVTSPFGYRWGRQHKGIDLAGNTGDPIGAAKAGTVIAAGRQGGYGNLVLVDHHDGIVTAYAHMSEILAFAGQSVERGERLGSVGNTGNSTGPHLHFETRVNGAAVNPVGYLPNGC